MSNDLVIEQKQSLGNTGTQIGQQNVYNGLTPEEASQLSINLFMNNFPKLQEQAMEKVEKLVKEFCNTTVKKLVEAQVNDFSEFTTPDMQYVLVEAQTNYARFGNEKLLSLLSDLVVHRVVSNNDEYFKIVLDKAISVVPNLTQGQLDALTLLFYYKKVMFKKIKNLKDVQEHFEKSSSIFNPCGNGGYSLLNSLGCLDLDLGEVCERVATTYTLNKADVENVCPLSIKDLHCDYSPSHVGIIIAIINSNNKTNYEFDPQKWIRN